MLALDVARGFVLVELFKKLLLCVPLLNDLTSEPVLSL